MKAILFKREKSAMQAGLALSSVWVLKPITDEKIASQYQSLRWDSSFSTIKQQELKFPNKESAISYCKQYNISYTEISHHTKTIKPKSYTETITQ